MLVETAEQHARMNGRNAGGRGFRHESLFYAGEEEFLAGTLLAVERALDLGHPVLVGVGQEKAHLLRRALGRRAPEVGFLDMSSLGRNPARIIPLWAQFLAERAQGGGQALGISEPAWPGRTTAELAECERHERLLNLAFGSGQEWRLLCPYDVAALDERWVAAARASHPFDCCGGATARNGAYNDPDWAAGGFDGYLPPAPLGGVTEIEYAAPEIADVRAAVAGAAAGAGLPPERAQDAVLAASELASNSVRHGGGRGIARIWRDGSALLCEISDRGVLRAPLAGRVRPTPQQLDGRGLWLVNQLCDLVQIRSGAGGTVVRVRMEV